MRSPDFVIDEFVRQVLLSGCCAWNTLPARGGRCIDRDARHTAARLALSRA